MRKLNYKLLCLSIYAVIITGYFYPFHLSEGSKVLVGFPFRYFTIYSDMYKGNSLFTSCHLSLGGLLGNMLVYYLALLFIKKIYSLLLPVLKGRLKKKQNMESI